MLPIREYRFCSPNNALSLELEKRIQSRLEEQAYGLYCEFKSSLVSEILVSRLYVFRFCVVLLLLPWSVSKK